jgi:hypothetical protein
MEENKTGINIDVNQERRSENQEINTNLKITRLDKQKLLTQIKQLKELLSNESNESNEEELKNQFEYLYNNLPIMFNTIKNDPTMPMDIIENMIHVVYLLGNGQVDQMQARIYIGNLLHERYTKINQ